MCGIAAIMRFDSGDIPRATIQGMTDTMSHRGPDADGFFLEPGIALGHRRLSIIDLSEAANQPFSDNANRYRIIFNGEMYNYAEVKTLITDYHFKTTSDTEVLIAAYSKWGADCIRYFRGMFTFIIWDRQQKEVFIARDRMGVKPLYYFISEDYLIVASEVRAILSTGLVEKKINPQALREYFAFQSISFPFSLIQGINQLRAGSWMRVKNRKVEQEVYWDVTAQEVNFEFSDLQKTKKRIRELLLQSVKRRLVSDVPVGAFLSGGIDSSIVVGLMAEAGKGIPNTFNISFDEKEFDESYYAELVAGKFQTHHTTIKLKPSNFLDELIHALDAMDTPSGDGINTYVVSKAIRRNGMIVALSGIGGDELFAGYPYFEQYLQMHKKSWLWKLPKPIRKATAIGAGDRKERIGQLLESDGPSISNVYPVFRQILSPKLIRQLTRLEFSNSTAVQEELTNHEEALANLPLLSQVSAAEYMGYTQHTLLKDADQMSMAVSLELREPFFDNDLVEFVLAIPDELKKSSYPKSLLVESVKPMLPEELVFRKKQGFLFPWSIWMKNELRTFCNDHIERICQRSFIRGEALKAYWQSFLSGHPGIRWTEIWLFVVLEYWLEKNEIG